MSFWKLLLRGLRGLFVRDEKPARGRPTRRLHCEELEDRAVPAIAYSGGTYTQNFNGLPSSGTFTLSGNGPFDLSASPINASGFGTGDWYIAKSGGSGSNALFTVGTGSSNAGSVYSFGSSSSSDRALGSLASGSVASRFGAVLTNTTGQTLTSFTISFTTEQWRFGGGVKNTLSFEYALGASGINSGTFTAVTGLDAVSPITSGTTGALDGNASANRSSVTSTVSGISWANNQSLVIRWNDADDSGSDDGLAIDDFSFSGSTGNTPPTINGGPSATVYHVAGTTAVTTVMATDAQNDPITYSISGGADATKFDISSSGALAFKAAPNYFSPGDVGADNVYNVTVQASDNKGASSTQALAVEVYNSAASFVSFTGAAYTQDFNSLQQPSPGPDPADTSVKPLGNSFYSSDGGSALAGWSYARVGGDTTRFSTDTGSSGTGSVFNYGATSASDRALGSLNSGSTVSQFGVVLRNDTGASLNSFTVEFTGEQWRRGNTTSGAADKLAFAYSLGGSDINTGTFVTFAALDFTGPNTTTTTGALNGNDAANRKAASATVTGITWASGQNLVLRWADFDLSGADDGLAIDDFKFSAIPPNSPPVIAGGATASASAKENSTAATTVKATDPDGDAVSYSVAGGADQALFAIDSSSGALTFKSAPDFENPTDADKDNKYEVTVQASDGKGGTATQNLTITVTDVGLSLAVVGNDLVLAELDAGNDGLEVARSGDALKITHTGGAPIEASGISGATGSGTSTVTAPLSAFSGKFIVNSGAGDDTLAVDFSGGNPIPSSGLVFNGGAGGNDKLVLTGGSTTTVTHAFTNATDGSVTLAGSLAGTIDYTGLDPITDNLSAVDRVFTFNGGAETITLTDASGANMTIGSTLAESVTFSNPAGSLTINAGSGDDTVTISSVDAAFDASLAVNGDAGNDTVNLNAGITFASGKNLDVDLQNDNAGTPGTDTINVGAGAKFALSGSGAATLRASRNITFASGAGVSVVDGNLAIEANQQAAVSSGTFVGIDVNGAEIKSGGSGNITIAGRSGSTGTTSNTPAGVDLRGGAAVKSTSTLTDGTAGKITINAVEATSTTVSGSGLRLDGSGTAISSAYGNIDITARGGSGGSGQGATAGLRLNAGTVIESTGTGAAAAKINVSASTGNNFQTSVGVQHEAATIRTVDGAIDITAAGMQNGGNGGRSYLMNSGGLIQSTGAGSITVNGNSTASSGNNRNGVEIASGASITSSGTGAVTLNGVWGSNNGTGGGLVLNGAIQTNGNGLTLVADGVVIGGTVNAGAGTVTIRQRTAGKAINLGGADSYNATATSGNLGLTNAELGQVAAGTIQVGDANSGPVTVSAAITRSSATNLKVFSGGAINFASAGSLSSAGGNVLLDPGTSVGPKGTGTFDVSAAAATPGTLSFGSGDTLVIALSGTGGDVLTVAGLVNLTGAKLDLSGTPSTSVGQMFTLVDNDGADAVTGTFDGLAEGAKALNFFGSGNHAVITYKGGDGNDVVLTVVAPNSPPVIAGGATASVSAKENSTAATTVKATDPDGDAVSYSIAGGADQALFAIDSNTGQLAFLSAPDYEKPADAGKDNVYDVVVQASDGKGGTATQAVAVTVTDAYEVVGFKVQNGQAQRSYVRYLEVEFDSEAAATAALSAVRLRTWGLSGTSATAVSLSNLVSRSGNKLLIDFGVEGIGGGRNSATGDGYYRLEFDLDGDKAYETGLGFHRLLGDANGDGQVSQADVNVYYPNGTLSYAGAPDLNGDGRVDSTDINLIRRAIGRKVTTPSGF